MPEFSRQNNLVHCEFLFHQGFAQHFVAHQVLGWFGRLPDA